jgi:viologen exporter family transport system permease protein
MRLYWEVGRSTVRRLTAYRGATFAGVFTNTVFGFLLTYVLLAVFRERPEIGGYDATDAVTYTFVAQGLIMAVGMFGDLEMALRVRTGDVAIDMFRPYDFQAWWAATAFGRAAFYAVFRGLPPVLVGALAFDLRMPAEAWVWPAFFVSVVLAVGVGFAWGFLCSSACSGSSTCGARYRSAGWWPTSSAGCSSPSCCSPTGSSTWCGCCRSRR